MGRNEWIKTFDFFTPIPALRFNYKALMLRCIVLCRGESEDWKGKKDDWVKLNSMKFTMTASDETTSTLQISQSAYLAAGYTTTGPPDA